MILSRILLLLILVGIAVGSAYACEVFIINGPHGRTVCTTCCDTWGCTTTCR